MSRLRPLPLKRQTTSMNYIRLYTLNFLCLVIGISFIGCTYAGYYIGNRIDNHSDKKIAFQQISMNDSTRVAIAEIPLKSEWTAHLMNGDIFSATFEGTNTARDTLVFQIDDETRNVSANSIDYLAKKNFKPAAKIGLLLGIGIDVVVIIEVIKALTAKKHDPIIM